MSRCEELASAECCYKRVIAQPTYQNSGLYPKMQGLMAMPLGTLQIQALTMARSGRCGSQTVETAIVWDVPEGHRAPGKHSRPISKGPHAVRCRSRVWASKNQHVRNFTSGRDSLAAINMTTCVTT